MTTFFDSIEKFGDSVALMTENDEMTFSQLDRDAKLVCRDISPRALVICVCSNCYASVVGYVGFIQKHIIPIMINESINRELFKSIVSLYRPGYVWCKSEFFDGDCVLDYKGYSLYNTGEAIPASNDDLALLLTTSGSTGSPKFVRQSYKNIQSNTEAIVNYLNINCRDRAITTLPMSYTYGLSILQSHLMAGACVLLTELSVLEKEFYNLVKKKEITTFGAVPYTYQMLDRLRFLKMDFPSLRYITQAGGKLSCELHTKFARALREKGKSFIVMYGATEATARMSYVPSEYSVEKSGSIGIAIPGGRFELVDEHGGIIDDNETVGELVYYGDNVTLGYAEKIEDLVLEDMRRGRLETGDMAKRDEDGFYYIVGRKKRFLKVFGNRINLEEVEGLLLQAGYESACTGEDDCVRIFTTYKDISKVISYISEKTGLNHIAFDVRYVEMIPRNDSGKVMYSKLQ